jgi:hypothetical protein
MRDVEIKTELFGRDRYVTVLFVLDQKTSEYVNAWFIDPENPDETSEAERERLIARARELMRQVAGPEPQSRGLRGGFHNYP